MTSLNKTYLEQGYVIFENLGNPRRIVYPFSLILDILLRLW